MQDTRWSAVTGRGSVKYVLLSSSSSAQPYPDCILEEQMKSWTSPFYAHFKLPPKIVSVKPGVTQYEFYCLMSVYLILLLVHAKLTLFIAIRASASGVYNTTRLHRTLGVMSANVRARVTTIKALSHSLRRGALIQRSACAHMLTSGPQHHIDLSLS